MPTAGNTAYTPRSTGSAKISEEMSKIKLANRNEVTNIRKPYFRNYGANHNGSSSKYAVPRPTPRNPHTAGHPFSYP